MPEEEELISVVIPCYERRGIVARAVASALAQRGVQTQIILCDDGSTDGTWEDWEHDSRVLYLRLPHRGACAARNAGIDAALGKWIAFLDSDDTWQSTKLRDQLALIRATGADAVCSSFHRHDGEDVTLAPSAERISGTIEPKDLLTGNLVSTQTILGRTDLIRQVRFDESLSRFQDWDFAMRLARAGQLWYDAAPTADVYLQRDSISRRPELGLKSLPVIYERSAGLYRSSLRGTLAWQDHVYMLTSGCEEDGHALYRMSFDPARPLKDRVRVRLHAAALRIRHRAVYHWREATKRRRCR